MFIVFALLFKFAQSDHPIVQTKSGEILGFQTTTETGHVADIFLGIPFAEPPIGELRFEKPLPVKSWIILNATKFGYECVPHTLQAKIFEVNEDCLTLNVIRPAQKPPSDGFPVLVWIHGGGYEIGSARLYGYQGFADAFVHREVIIVTLQYRLGVLGFFSTGEDELPGNLGLWDQALAIKWLHDNIALFGGDPNRLTLWGLSAGGGAVGQLLLSPHTRDLVAFGVEMSGSPFASWAIGSSVENNSISLAAELGCFDFIKACMKTKTIAEINNAVETIGTTTKDMKIIKWGPRIDGGFLPDIPEKLIKEASPKPVILGVSDKDAAYFTIMDKSPYIQGFQATKDLFSFKEKEMVKRIDDLIRSSLEYNSEKAYQNIINHYLEEKEKANDAFYLNRYTEFITDTMFNIPLVEEAEAKIKANWPVYLYKFEHYNDAIWKPINAPKGVQGSVHVNEFTYMFDAKWLAQWDYTQADISVKENLRNALANFAKTGKPIWSGVTWPKATAELKYLIIKEDAEIKINFFKDSANFWKAQKEFGFDAITMLRTKEVHDEL